uniref:Uncharacterized protein n=1 Tax=Anguilla anguilla TaxID=7936 RepID=A0A0E9SGQ6_ANGAN
MSEGSTWLCSQLNPLRFQNTSELRSVGLNSCQSGSD